MLAGLVPVLSSRRVITYGDCGNCGLSFNTMLVSWVLVTWVGFGLAFADGLFPTGLPWAGGSGRCGCS